jgi:hypothetical protein
MATRYDSLIDSLFTDAASRLLATDFVTRFADDPMMATRVEPLLREAALANGRVLSGEITSQEGRAYLNSFASEGLGTPAHLLASGQAWLNDVVAAEAEQTDDAPRGAEPRGPQSDLINRLFAPADRAAARALVSALGRDPQTASRTEALLHEIARTADMPPQAAYDYIASFARSIGIPDHLVTSALDAISAPAERAHEEAVTRELIGDRTPQAEHAQRVSEREAGQRDAAKYERMMRENPSEYWRPENQAAYRQALERSLVEVPVMPAAEPPAAPSPEPASPAPAAAAPAPPPIQPVAP